MILGILLFVVVAVIATLFQSKIVRLLMKISIPGKSNVWEYLLYILLVFGFIIGFLFFWFHVVEPTRF